MKAAVIGAGASGRGFIGRLLYENGVHISFIDKNTELVDALREKGSYNISFGEGREPETVSGYEIYRLESDEALNSAREADIIFVSVGFSRLKDLKPFFDRLRGLEKDVVVCENGLLPRSEFLKSVMPDKKIKVSQGVIFCTTIPDSSTPGGILSEKYDELPYDSTCGVTLALRGFRPESRFEDLMRRKIFTYNCISAEIAYIGYYKGYTCYADAARDADVEKICAELRKQLDKVLSVSFGVTMADQTSFSQRAVDKFRDRTISDTITKNARGAVRKLSPAERIMGPAGLFAARGEDQEILLAVAGAALYYLKMEETPKLGEKEYSDLPALFADENGLDRNGKAVMCAEKYFNACVNGTFLEKALLLCKN